MNYKKRLVYVLLVILTMILFLGLTHKVVEAYWYDWLLGGTREVIIELPPPPTLDSEIDRLAIKYEVSSSTIRAVVKCESQMYGGAVNKNRNTDGSVWSTDWGYLQINDYFHQKRMENLGLDIHDEWESLEYGFILFKSQGSSPWNASKSCWISKI